MVSENAIYSENKIMVNGEHKLVRVVWFLWQIKLHISFTY